MRFAVVIATYNRPTLLLRALASVLAAEQYCGFAVEVIVVDDCSSAPLPQLPESVKVVRTDQNGGPGLARMLGIRSANAEQIVILDDDDLIRLDAFVRLSAYFEQAMTSDFPVTMFSTNSKGFLGDDRILLLHDYFSGKVVGDLVPIINRIHFLEKKLSYPDLRAGGEGLLWMDIASRFGGIPVSGISIVDVTDAAEGRLTDSSSQLRNATDLRSIALTTLDRYGHTLKAEYPDLYMNRVSAVILYSLVIGDKNTVDVFSKEIGNKLIGFALMIFSRLPRVCGEVLFRFSRWLQRRR